MHRCVTPFLLFVALAPGLHGVAARAASTAGALDATEIYDRTRVAVAARRLPPYIAYTQYAAFARHGKIQAERSRVILRLADGKANIVRLPDSPTDRVNSAPVVADRPLVNPTTTFGLVKRRSGEAPSAFETPSTPAPALAEPVVIGRVSAIARDYDPTLIGTENLAGSPVYHLHLTPRFDPRRHPIRELYVDTATFDPRRIAIEVWAAAGPIRSRPTVNVDFAPIDGTWMIAHAAMDFVLRFAFFNYGGSAEYRTSDVSFPADEPAWLFDAALLAAHAHAHAGAP